MSNESVPQQLEDVMAEFHADYFVHFWTVVLSIWACIGMFGLCANGLIIFLFAKFRELRTKHGLYFMTLLAVYDAVFCVGVVTSCVSTLFVWNAVYEGDLPMLTYWQCIPHLLPWFLHWFGHASLSNRQLCCCGRPLPGRDTPDGLSWLGSQVACKA